MIEKDTFFRHSHPLATFYMLNHVAPLLSFCLFLVRVGWQGQHSDFFSLTVVLLSPLSFATPPYL